jgi:hypothetical protein
MSWSNKRTANLPNPCPVALQSCCSILLGSSPLGLHQVTALSQTHTRQDTHLSAAPASNFQTHSMQEYPPLSRVLVSMTTGIPANSPCQTPGQSRSHSLLEYHPPPLSPPPFRPCWAPATHGMTGYLPLGLPPPIRPCLAQIPCWTTRAPPHWDRHQPGRRQPHPPACQEPHPVGGDDPSCTGFPDNCSTRFPFRLPLEGSKCA